MRSCSLESSRRYSVGSRSEREESACPALMTAGPRLLITSRSSVARCRRFSASRPSCWSRNTRPRKLRIGPSSCICRRITMPGKRPNRLAASAGSYGGSGAHWPSSGPTMPSTSSRACCSLARARSSRPDGVGPSSRSSAPSGEEASAAPSTRAASAIRSLSSRATQSATISLSSLSLRVGSEATAHGRDGTRGTRLASRAAGRVPP